MRFTFLFAALVAASPIGAAAELPLNVPCTLKAGGNLGPNFAGHSTKSVYKLLAAGRPRDEFESDAAYVERMAGVVATAPDAVRQGALCAVGQLHFTSSSYDAEAQQFKVDALLVASGWIEDGHYSRFARVYGGESSRKDSKYTGTNAYGVTRTIFRMQRDSYFAAFTEADVRSAASEGSAEYESVTLAVIVPMRPESARRLKDHLDIAVLYEPRPTYTTENTEYERPTLDDPSDSDDHQHIVRGKIRSIAVFDRTTGEVFKVIELHPQPAASQGT